MGKKHASQYANFGWLLSLGILFSTEEDVAAFSFLFTDTNVC